MAREIKNMIENWFGNLEDDGDRGWRVCKVDREDIDKLIKEVEDWLDNN